MSLRGQRAVTISSGHAIRFLVTLIGNTSVALPAQWVRGIVTPDSADPGGAVTWAGAHYQPTDLAARLKVDFRDRSADTRLVLYGNEEASRSFIVDRVLGLLDVERAQIHPLPTQFRGRERERLLGFFVAPSCVALIANPFWALELPLRPQALEMFAIRFPERKVEDGAPPLPLPEAAMNEPVPMPAGTVR
jgi:hypothetical protein